MEQEKRNYIFLGEAGGGKSELAVNLALALAEKGERPVHLFDMDMTKPLFRSRDLAELLTGAGVTVHFQEQFMDAPTVAGGVSRLLRDGGCDVILDVGGDSAGARSIGGYAPLLNAPDAALCYVINPYRPWSADLEHIDLVLGQVLGVSHLAVEDLHLIANPNLGPGTTARDVAAGCAELLRQLSPYKPLECLVAEESLCAEVAAAVPIPVRPLRLYLTYPWMAAVHSDTN